MGDYNSINSIDNLVDVGVGYNPTSSDIYNDFNKMLTCFFYNETVNRNNRLCCGLDLANVTLDFGFKSDYAGSLDKYKKRLKNIVYKNNTNIDKVEYVGDIIKSAYVEFDSVWGNSVPTYSPPIYLEFNSNGKMKGDSLIKIVNSIVKLKVELYNKIEPDVNNIVNYDISILDLNLDSNRWYGESEINSTLDIALNVNGKGNSDYHNLITVNTNNALTRQTSYFKILTKYYSKVDYKVLFFAESVLTLALHTSLVALLTNLQKSEIVYLAKDKIYMELEQPLDDSNIKGFIDTKVFNNTNKIKYSISSFYRDVMYNTEQVYKDKNVIKYTLHSLGLALDMNVSLSGDTKIKTSNRLFFFTFMLVSYAKSVSTVANFITFVDLLFNLNYVNADANEKDMIDKAAKGIILLSSYFYRAFVYLNQTHHMHFEYANEWLDSSAISILSGSAPRKSKSDVELNSEYEFNTYAHILYYLNYAGCSGEFCDRYNTMMPFDYYKLTKDYIDYYSDGIGDNAFYEGDING